MVVIRKPLSTVCWIKGHNLWSVQDFGPSTPTCRHLRLNSTTDCKLLNHLRTVTRLDQLSWHPSLFKVAASAAAEACFYFWTLMEVIQSYFTLWFGGLVGVTGLWICPVILIWTSWNNYNWDDSCCTAVWTLRCSYNISLIIPHADLQTWLSPSPSQSASSKV